jgi:hypothetical protein
MPLETGAWTIKASGSTGQLIIEKVDVNTGRVDGVLTLGGIAFNLSGIWNEASQKLTFQVSSQNPQPTAQELGAFQFYEGFLFTDQLRLFGIVGSVVFTLAGHFQVVIPRAVQGLIPATSQKSRLGWYAQIGVN